MLSLTPLSSFSRHLRVAAALASALIVVFSVYMDAEKQVDHANELRYRSRLLAGELRQSSDDLTRMVRTYVLAGNPAYKGNAVRPAQLPTAWLLDKSGKLVETWTGRMPAEAWDKIADLL